MTDVLADLVACDRYRGLFPAGMPFRACLRRQLEKQHEGKGWVPRRPFCASECPLGFEVCEAIEGVPLGTCTRCGAALVGTTACEPCGEERSLHVVPRRSPERPPPQDRIWSAGAPDAPIAPPPRGSSPASPRRRRRP